MKKRLKEIEPEIIFSLYMFLKNYPHQKDPKKIFLYIKSQWEFIKSKIL